MPVEDVFFSGYYISLSHSHQWLDYKFTLQTSQDIRGRVNEINTILFNHIENGILVSIDADTFDSKENLSAQSLANFLT